jgi:Transglutaminase elicitor
MSTTARRIVLLVLTLALVAPAPAAAQDAPYPAEFPIPNGYFYTQASPRENGSGYRVANEGGIPFWDEFQRLGGLDRLGYPVSGRFLVEDHVVQLFRDGALRWLPDEERAELLSPRMVGEPPRHAKRPSRPPRWGGNADHYPWSGWWWPANHQAGGPRLFDSNGPLAKYDRWVESLGEPDPRTLEWEASEIMFTGLRWAGHCNGWAAAALLEAEPSEPRVLNGINFSIADQKGLLTSYHFADAALWAAGGEDRELSPAEFHRTLTFWLGEQRRGMILTFRLAGEEVWSYPAFKFESVAGPDPALPNVSHVRTVVWLADNNVPSDFVGGRPWPGPDGKVFEYTLVGDPSEPEGGEWGPNTAADFGRPYMVWYPDPNRRNEGRQLASPALEYGLIQRIIRGE